MRALKPSTGADSIMSSALPVASSAATSTITTSARSAWAISWAQVAPTLPAPTTVTLYRIAGSPKFKSEVLEDRARERRGAEEGRALHLPLKVVGDPLLLDGPGERLLDGVAGLDPPQPAQHHDPGEDQRAGVDLVLVGVLGRRAVGGLEDGEAVPLVAAGCHAEAAHLRRQGVGEIVAVQVGGGQDVVLLRAQQHLLEGRVGDAVLDDDLPLGRLAAVRAPDLVLGDGVGAELLARHLVAPVLEGPLGELHDVALVHQGDVPAAVGDGELEGLAHQPLAAGGGDRLDADAAVRPHVLVEAGEELDELLRL